ncbi:MAG: T9SS type A sorting domain-containing protein [Bacteroidales bacterium]
MSVSVFPNPARRAVFINGITGYKAQVSMFNLKGAKVFEDIVETDKGFDVSGYSPGAYILQIETIDRKEKQLLKLVIQ